MGLVGSLKFKGLSGGVGLVSVDGFEGVSGGDEMCSPKWWRILKFETIKERDKASDKVCWGFAEVLKRRFGLVWEGILPYSSQDGLRLKVPARSVGFFLLEGIKCKALRLLSEEDDAVITYFMTSGWPFKKSKGCTWSPETVEDIPSQELARMHAKYVACHPQCHERYEQIKHRFVL
jgi:hypothetical protein